ncbi:hypothetical protein [Photorhabdus caribbeanensis]|nr:hypothetical protein [Photorhabdus caribbeanensis]
MKIRQNIETGTSEIQGTGGECREKVLNELRKACGPIILQRLMTKA